MVTSNRFPLICMYIPCVLQPHLSLKSPSWYIMCDLKLTLSLLSSLFFVFFSVNHISEIHEFADSSIFNHACHSLPCSRMTLFDDPVHSRQECIFDIFGFVISYTLSLTGWIWMRLDFCVKLLPQVLLLINMCGWSCTIRFKAASTSMAFTFPLGIRK